MHYTVKCESPVRHDGFRGAIARTTLAEANETRDWCIYADFAHGLIAIARGLYATTEDVGLELTRTIDALDATMIELCLSLFPWATFRPKLIQNNPLSAPLSHPFVGIIGPALSFVWYCTAHNIYAILWACQADS